VLAWSTLTVCGAECTFGAPSSISVLLRIRDAARDHMEILMDGGIRSGQDVAKALALGAKAVLLGRTWA
jgi:L-lactate dehydrogenase (cytochrome)